MEIWYIDFRFNEVLTFLIIKKILAMDYSSLKIGDELNGDKILKVYSQTKDYIVYTRKGYKSGITYANNEEIDIGNLERPIIVNKSRLDNFLTNREKKKALLSYAHVYTACFEGNPEEANNILNNIKSQIIQVRKNKEKFIFLTIYLFHIPISLILYVMLLYVYSTYETGLNINYPNIFLCALLGSFGGYISTSLKIKTLECNIYSGILFKFARAMSRVAISMIAGIITYALVKSNIILGVIDNLDKDYMLYVICAFSGFSERFIPDVFSSVGKTIEINKNVENSIPDNNIQTEEKGGYFTKF